MTTGRKILVLESDRAAAFPMGAGLRKSGWLVVSAQDAAMAMSMARQQKPDAVLLNSRLAGGGGLTALKRLRSSVYTTMIPVICIVPPDSPEKLALIDAGAQETVDPPGDPKAVDAALQRYLARGDEVVLVPPAVLSDSERLKALSESRLLDTPPEDGLDRVTKLAAQMLGVPLARLSIVDKDRQFFKSQADLSPSPVRIRQTPISNSICQWVAGGNEELIVGDAREHPVLRTNLAVRDDGAVAYAGVPFTLDDQTTLGSFCVVDSQPRIWTEEQVTTLRNLGVVIRAYATRESQDETAKVAAVGNALIAATNVLLRGGVQCGQPQREELCRMIEELSGRLVRLVQMKPALV